MTPFDCLTGGMRFLAALLFSCLTAGVSSAQLSQIDMSEREVRDFLGGNTIGSNDFGDDDGVEFHGTDGRALWFYEEELKVGYYRVKNNRVCYTYEGEDLGEWYCWIFKKDRRTGEVWQWTEDEQGFHMFIVGKGDLASPEVEPLASEEGIGDATEVLVDALDELLDTTPCGPACDAPDPDADQ